MHTSHQRPARPRIGGLLLALAIGLSTAACSSASPAAKRASALFEAGRYNDAYRTASDELSRTPRDAGLHRIRVRAALARGDSRAAVTDYNQYRQSRGGSHDDRLLRDMALTTLWRGLKAPSEEVVSQSIRIVERLEIEALARDVGDHVADDSDFIAATASVALLRSHPQAPAVATDLLFSDDPRARVVVIRGIARKIGKHAKDDLRGKLKDGNPKVRKAAVQAVGSLRDQDDAEALIRIATTDKDQAVRAFAMRELAAGPYKVPANIGIRAMRDPHIGVQLAGVRLLARKSDAAGRLELRKLVDTGAPSVALRASVEWRGLGEPAVVGPVERALASDEWNLRAAALNSVVEAAGKQFAAKAALDKRFDSEMRVKLAAARVLYRVDQVPAATAVLVTLLGSGDIAIQLDAALELARHNNAQGFAKLESLATHERTPIRAGAIAGLTANKQFTDALVTALADTSVKNRLAAAEAIWRLTDD